MIQKKKTNECDFALNEQHYKKIKNRSWATHDTRLHGTSISTIWQSTSTTQTTNSQTYSECWTLNIRQSNASNWNRKNSVALLQPAQGTNQHCWLLHNWSKFNHPFKKIWRKMNVYKTENNCASSDSKWNWRYCLRWSSHHAVKFVRLVSSLQTSFQMNLERVFVFGDDLSQLFEFGSCVLDLNDNKHEIFDFGYSIVSHIEHNILQAYTWM